MILVSVRLLGCASAPPEPVVPPELAVEEVVSRLQRAAELAATDRASARDTLASARVRFEQAVEPNLRQTRDPLDVSAAEYGFARVQHALDAGADPRQEVDILVRRLHPPRLAHR